MEAFFFEAFFFAFLPFFFPGIRTAAGFASTSAPGSVASTAPMNPEPGPSDLPFTATLPSLRSRSKASWTRSI